MLTPWKESYDQPRQHIKKQRHYFTNKGLSSQGYVFSISRVWMWKLDYIESCSVQVSLSVVSDSLRPHELQHARPPCPSPTPRVHQNPFPSSRWCHPTISSSVIPFSWLQYFPASGSFQMSQLFASGGQSIGVSASTSILPMNTQDWPPLGWTGWIYLQSKGLKSLLQHHSSKALILRCSAFFSPTLTSIHDYWKNHSFD